MERRARLNNWRGLACVLGFAIPFSAASSTLAEQNGALLRELRAAHALNGAQIEAVREIFARSGVVGQGNPAISRHPSTVAQCRAKLDAQHVRYANPDYVRVCDSPYMAPLYDPTTTHADAASVCIDQFEFPNIPCAYPVVWVRAREAAEICAAVGKRLCDAHEWEGMSGKERAPGA